jgi:hypothetical protein
VPRQVQEQVPALAQELVLGPEPGRPPARLLRSATGIVTGFGTVSEQVPVLGPEPGLLVPA